MNIKNVKWIFIDQMKQRLMLYYGQLTEMQTYKLLLKKRLIDRNGNPTMMAYDKNLVDNRKARYYAKELYSYEDSYKAFHPTSALKQMKRDRIAQDKRSLHYLAVTDPKLYQVIIKHPDASVKPGIVPRLRIDADVYNNSAFIDYNIATMAGNYGRKHHCMRDCLHYLRHFFLPNSISDVYYSILLAKILQIKNKHKAKNVKRITKNYLDYCCRLGIEYMVKNGFSQDDGLAMVTKATRKAKLRWL